MALVRGDWLVTSANYFAGLFFTSLHTDSADLFIGFLRKSDSWFYVINKFIYFFLKAEAIKEPRIPMKQE